MGVGPTTYDEFTANKKVREILVTAPVQLNVLQHGLGLFKAILNIFLAGNPLLGESIGVIFAGWSFSQMQDDFVEKKRGLPEIPKFQQ